ncbi:hypothetical protein [uncultured Mediterranean phage uvMED]|nr:hypothetical protein [uncultured Mediterranean phage uvMED]
MKYLIKHWATVDILAEEIVDDKDIKIVNNNLGKYEEPSDKAIIKVLNVKVNRRTYEDDKKSNDSSKERTSD